MRLRFRRRAAAFRTSARRDIVNTWSVDSRVVFALPKTCSQNLLAGNPIDRSFLWSMALHLGDSLVVRFDQILRLNRDTARSSPLIVNTALTADYVERR